MASAAWIASASRAGASSPGAQAHTARAGMAGPDRGQERRTRGVAGPRRRVRAAGAGPSASAVTCASGDDSARAWRAGTPRRTTSTKLPAHRSATARNSRVVAGVSTGSVPTARSMRASRPGWSLAGAALEHVPVDQPPGEPHPHPAAAAAPPRRDRPAPGSRTGGPDGAGAHRPSSRATGSTAAGSNGLGPPLRAAELAPARAFPPAGRSVRHERSARRGRPIAGLRSCPQSYQSRATFRRRAHGRPGRVTRGRNNSDRSHAAQVRPSSNRPAGLRVAWPRRIPKSRAQSKKCSPRGRP